MRFLFILALIAACIVGLGLYRGWFHLTSDHSAEKPNITITVDKDKLHEDRRKAVGKVQDLGHQAKDRAAAPAQPTTK